MTFSELLLLILLLLSLLNLKVLVVKADDAPIIAKPGCKDTCGGVSIPFPFGIGPNCFLDHWFEIECKIKPFLTKFNVEVMELSTYGYSDYGNQNLVVKLTYLKVCDANTQPRQPSAINLTGSPYRFAKEDNVFVLEGCPVSAVLIDESEDFMEGCGTICSINNNNSINNINTINNIINNNNNNNNNNEAISTNSCYGVQCCQTQALVGLSYQVVFNPQDSGRSQNCFAATLIKSDLVDQYAGKILSSDSSSITIPVVLSWSWISKLTADNSSHSTCYGTDTLFCECDADYDGNPYVSGGCQVAHDCKHCRGYCNRRCTEVTEQRRYDGLRSQNCSHSFDCQKPPELATILHKKILRLSIGFGIVLLVIAVYGLYRFIKRRRELKRRAKLFKRNGGLLLQQQLSSNEGVIEKTKVFTISELDKATDHFNENRILGQGGQGTVYKGMLIDGRIVAIKKAKLLDERQLEQFINEVVILSQINHRNVVKMLGCCLETEVPLLVYEFVPNGTLSQHIHDPDEDFVISWEKRLKIASDSASAIAYLHSSSSLPIYHRDIKSSNILLDEKHRAKVSDFGSSKTISIDQTHLTTLVQGTTGYLDPEYFQSYQFTEKSDVYSFGVVLLEILTSKKPVYRDESMEQKNLVIQFFSSRETSSLSNFVDPEIVKQAKDEELDAVIHLAKCCVNWSGNLRPNMKEVAMILEMIIKSPTQASTWYQQAFAVPREGVVENSVSNASEAEFMSSPLPAAAYSPLYIDQQPLLPDTI